MADFDAVVQQRADVNLSMVAESLPPGLAFYISQKPQHAFHVAAAHGLLAHMAVTLHEDALTEAAKLPLVALPDEDPDIRGWVPKTALQYSSICHQDSALRLLLSLRADPLTACPGADNGCHRGHQAIHFLCWSTSDMRSCQNQHPEGIAGGWGFCKPEI
eukprot:TRINITY_DN108365_c0_g1_i1.p1 TRINITY_DN108365_c0_g1~~TRINITY_DN108365_c0_g1_i1.p1  ORF type:complete len:160 (-),score=26.84 TRINITY_DN108365_c0_g1_i1:486-965(-)